MKMLILMRHAKSDWSLSLDDHARPLNNRGQRAAPALGAWLKQHDYLPDQVLCSDARRTMETFDMLDLDVTAQLDARLYLATAEEMLHVLREAEGDRVLMLGHNPGIADLAELLLADRPDHHRFGDYPTGATLVARFDIDRWDKVEPGIGRVVDFIIPRALG